MRHDRTTDREALQNELLAGIDHAAESVRGLFITNTASQAGVYLVKEAEARAFDSNPNLPADATPNLTREAARTGRSRAECAETILQKAAEWRTVSAVIEDMRLGAKDAVRAAPTPVEKRQAAVIDWSVVINLA